MSGNSKLKPLIFIPLSLGSISPGGWLLKQLQIQADGLSGHLDEFWSDIAQSGWIGGAAEGWERGPYWLDGVVPLAFLLNDEKLKAKVYRWMDYILKHQHPDGWLGPVQDQRYQRYEAYDPWPVYVTLKAMTQYYEATGDDRIMPAMERFFQRLDKLLDVKPLSSWGKSRWADLVLSIHWLFDHTGKSWLLDLAEKVHNQGYNWRKHFAEFRFKDKLKREECDQTTHVVNNAMAVKQPGIWFRQSYDVGDRDSIFQMLDMLDEYHGQVTGVFTGDEHYAGKDPSQGTELCAVVEYMFSLEKLISVTGDARLAERLERIAFNALPATFKPDMWAHQYDQQANQVICKIAEDRVYVNNGPDANIFGLEPNYGCCTSNMHQGWPKFVSHLWMKTYDDGLATIAYAPSTMTTEIKGKKVQITLETDYPFNDILNFTIKADQPVKFPLHLRIPDWVTMASFEIDGKPITRENKGGFFGFEREWSGSTSAKLSFSTRAKIHRRYHNSVSIQQGPLIYSLKMGEDWRQVRGEVPHADWEVYPTTPWNYALKIDTKKPEESLEFKSKPLGDCPFSPEGAPIVAKVKGKQIQEWKIEHNAAGPLPESPVISSEPLEELTLIPYGCTNLRVTEFPLLEE